jgi:hypothetical protein
MPSLSRHLGSIWPIEGNHYEVTVDGCWVWLGFIDRQGYGHVSGPSIQGERRAHRAAWANIYGPIPPGHHVHHRCKTLACINPEHLQQLTAQQHFMVHKLHEKTGLTLDDVREIRRLSLVPGMSAPVVAKRYGIHEITVYDYWSSNHWADLLGGEHAGRPVRTCPYCGGEFNGRRRHAVYCSKEHRIAFNAQKRKAA